MPQSFLVFNFGSNEEAAQQARHTIDRWKQGFRLDKKMLLKFDRKDANNAEASETANDRLSEGDLLLMVRLDFSEHEKLTHQRWNQRIPTEAPFRDAQPRLIESGESDFAKAKARFDALP